MLRHFQWPDTARGLAPLLLLATVFSAVPESLRAEQQTREPFPFRYYTNRGGDFRLTDQKGQPWAFQSARGSVVLLTFGYTHCPDICPATLAVLGATQRSLGEDRDAVRTVFVSLDPVRDTPAHLATYLANFDSDIVGLTGTEEEIRAVARQYHVKYAFRDGGPNLGVSIDHTAFIYLVDRQGRLRYLFPHVTPPDQLAQAVRQLQKGVP